MSGQIRKSERAIKLWYKENKAEPSHRSTLFFFFKLIIKQIDSKFISKERMNNNFVCGTRQRN